MLTGDHAFEVYSVGLYAMCALYMVTALAMRTDRGPVQDALRVLLLVQWAAMSACWMYRWWEVVTGGSV